ncbi:MAG: nucleotidyltransferase family protein [Actinobacteria bacterium]|nr:nucleotidyltransferase family protein [Actinomycetota bacterium]
MRADDVLAALIGGRDPGPLEGPALEDLPRRAAFHGLSALVAARALDLPSEVLADVLANAETARRRRAVLDLELRRVVPRGPSGAATPILIKGPAVARRYADPWLRTYVDIDLLVPEAELNAWAEALERLGYSGPTSWEEDAARVAHHHLVFSRPAPGGPLSLELHWRLFAERRAAALDHELLSPHCTPDDSLGGPLVASPEEQLVILAVHLAHHEPNTTKLMWLMDFAELGDPDVVRGARELASKWGVAWALENALAATEAVLGHPRWNARAEPLGAGLAAARSTGATGLRLHWAMVRELGPRKGLRYLARRLDPRRFRRPDGSVDWKALRAWLRRAWGGDQMGG